MVKNIELLSIILQCMGAWTREIILYVLESYNSRRKIIIIMLVKFQVSMLTIVIVTTLDLKGHIAKPTLTNVLPILVPTTPLALTKSTIFIVIVMKVMMVRTVPMISRNAKKIHVKI